MSKLSLINDTPSRRVLFGQDRSAPMVPWGGKLTAWSLVPGRTPTIVLVEFEFLGGKNERNEKMDGVL